ADTDQAACEKECEDMHAALPATCDCTYRDLLSCIGGATIQCPERVCNGNICADHPLAAVGCADLTARVKDCGGACAAHDSVTVGGGTATPSFSCTTTGCPCPAVLAPGAPSGAPCTTFSDCAETCCACGTGSDHFTSRLCLDGHCVGGPDS